MDKPKRTRRTKAEMAAYRATLPVTLELKPKRTRRSKAEMLASKPVTPEPVVVPVVKVDKLDEAANWIAEQMDETNRTYLLKYAKKKNISLVEMVKVYLLQEFGIKQACLLSPK